MSTDKTLADVQPGGMVRLGDQPPFIFARFVNGVRMAEGVTIEKERNLTDAMQVAAKVASKGPNGEIPVLVHVAALSAQPSPGGQDALDCIGRIEEAIEFRVPHDIYAAVHGELAELKAALSARQPVGEPVAWLVHWSDMPLESPEVTRSASRISEVSALTNSPRIVPLYAAPPAQAVDLGQFVPDPKAVPDCFAEDDSDAQYNSGWNDCRGAVLALIDSKAVGNG